ncbi:MAG: tRNA (N6-isopentenyl adenosine(37)-C2)-methylthiotransferase MiaB [Rickettsiales bacterium]|nr:tRNA (N6-isopentenyl adenosine(37)-C2)-methylthiotransferase MiaB [Rickettsiales bacterium]
MKRVYMRTFGCQMNELDSGKMLRLLEADGYVQTDSPELADVILLNTCSVREKPEQKLRSMMGRLRSLKEERDGLVLGVTGCYAQQESGALLRSFPYLDLVMGPDAIPRLPGLLLDVQLSRSRVLATEQLDRQNYPFTNDIVVRGEKGVTAFVTIQKGCDSFCSFCIVPFTRGREASRPAAEVLAEVRALAARGVAEVTVLGQNVNSYGLKKSAEPPFHELLGSIAAVPGIKRVRFTTSNPWDLDPGLVELFATEPRLCSYFHLPVQAGADSMLARMRRRHSREEYLTLVRDLRQARPDIALSTDIIVGFCGETEEEHQATLSLLAEVEYDFIYSFAYSVRPHTPAARSLADDVPAEVKKRRLHEVQHLQAEITQRKMVAFEGRRVPVLVEGPSRRDPSWLSGRISQNWIVNFPGDTALIGQLVEVGVERALSNSLLGHDPSPLGAKVSPRRRLEVLS